ncbi:MAG: Multidrug efflux pump Tap [Paraeggerthella hongkongensis]|uniref:MFS transporter n=1 Tax=Paraeggerthella TaxID=651554 RepID=UPI000DF7EEF8|nr:MFS transporter [Paraeggerthella sp. Marseille-Q4926]RDB55580.1 MFS transporter [Paraeggerthella hongkongensis]
MHGKGTTIRFLVSSTLSLLGNSIAAIALPLILLATTGDALAAGALALVCAVPQMLLGVLGGAALDRFNRRNISILSDLISAASVALIPIVDMIWGLNFWWFVVLGLMGAVGDIPGMTARDALLPTVTKRDGVDLQRFMGMSQSLDSLTTIVGPAIAALLIGTVGGTSALWFTAALSAAAAIVTMTLPSVVGVPETAAGEPIDAASPSPSRGIAAAAFGALREGLRVLLRSDRVLACSTLFSFGIVMVMGSFQGLVLPVHFTLTGQPELLGYVLSALSGGMLISSLAYAALAPRLSRRAWYVTSLVGMAVGVALLSTLPPFPLMLLGALVLGIAAGPASALLGFFMYDRIPDASRGSAFGTQNSIMLIAAPVAVFATSVAVSTLGERPAALILMACWGLITVAALLVKPMRHLDDESEASGEEASPEAAPAADR